MLPFRSSRPVSESGNQTPRQRSIAGCDNQGSPSGPSDPEEWTTVQGRRLSAVHRDFQDLARTLRETANNLQQESQRSGAQWQPPPRWESPNPWFPLSPQWVAPPHQTSIGFAPPSHQPIPPTWERERESSSFSPGCSRQKEVWQRQQRQLSP